MSLRIDSVNKTYPNGVHALRGITLTMSPGIFGLLGPNGAGKTSLMNTLATLQDPDSGEIKLDELDLAADRQKVRATLGYLPQHFGVYPKMSAVEMLDYLARLKGVLDPRERRDHIHGLLDLVNLSGAKNRAVDTYSGGMRQRFGIAQALIGAPRLIIVDEPTAGLDPSERNRFHRLLAEIGENAIVLLSTHIVEDVANLCTDMAVMYRGRVAAAGTPEQLQGALRGQLWSASVAQSDLPAYAERHQVLASRMQGGRCSVIVQADAKPGEEFAAKEPDLEDVYFAYVSDAA